MISRSLEYLHTLGIPAPKPSRRGDYQSIPPFIVEGTEMPDVSDKVKEIGYCEYNIMVNKEPDILGLYDNDDQLLEAYKRPDYRNFIVGCLSSPDSKNNYILLQDCCLSMIHFTPECLTVVSRSLDFTKAKYSDIYITWLFKEATGAKSWRFIALNPHEYVDRSKKAVRNE